MKIAILLPNLELYGGVRRFLCLSDALVDRGHEVTIYTREGQPCAWRPCRARFEFMRVPEDGTDVLVFADPNEEHYTRARASNAKLKMFYLCGIYDPKDFLIPEPKRTNEWIRKRNHWTRVCLEESSFVLAAASTWMAEFARENLKLQITTLMGGADPLFFHPVDVKHKLMSVVSPCERRFFKSEGLMERGVIGLVRKHGAPEATLDHWNGIPQEKLAKFLCGRSAFADDTILAGWHNPVIEAMACGVPVACYDIPGVQDFAVHGKTALLARVGDSLDLAKNIVQLLKQPKLAEELSRNAFEYQKNFTWGKCAEDFENLCGGQA